MSRKAQLFSTEVAPRPASPPPFDEDTDLFDYGLIRDWLIYALGSLRRRKLAMLVVFLVTFGAAASVVALLPRTYLVEATVLAQRNTLMASLGNPNRRVWDEAPTRAASETVLSRDNLISLVKQTNLIDEWDRTRAPILRIKDDLFRMAFGELSEDDKLDALVGILERSLFVQTGDGTVTIGVRWPDAKLAARLVETAVQNFLEARHVAEVSTIGEAISILEGHVSDVRESILQARAEITHREEEKKAVEKAASRRARTRQAPSDPQIAQLDVMIQARRRAIADLEDFRRRRLVELEGRLAEQRSVYAAAHPVIANLEESIESLSRESPQVTALRSEQEKLESELKARKAAAAAASAALQEKIEEAPRPISSGAEGAELPTAFDYDERWIELAQNKQADLLERIDAARIEMDTARAAFKYRYSVVRPPQVPRKPEKPQVPKLMMGAGVAALALAAMVAILLDLRSRRFLEHWQVERQLGLRLLGRVREE